MRRDLRVTMIDEAGISSSPEISKTDQLMETYKALVTAKDLLGVALFSGANAEVVVRIKNFLDGMGTDVYQQIEELRVGERLNAKK